jgi:YaiO family outer membrane protein
MMSSNLNNFSLRVLVITCLLGLTAPLSVAQENALPADAAPVSEVVANPSAVTEVQTKLLTNYVESGGSYLTLSNGYGYWGGGYTRGVYEQGKNVWNAEVNGEHEFGDAGVYFAAGDTHAFSPDWYGSLTVGSSAGGFFWPRFRTDAFLNKKWLARKQWITTGGYGYYDAKDIHRNQYAYVGSTYYFEKPWIVESGLYFNISNPGAVFAPSGFVAVTEGQNKRQYVTVRAGFGEEAYQLIGPQISLTQFQSQALTITWRKWMGPNWGFNFVGDYYRNPFYLRGGTSFGLFKDF